MASKLHDPILTGEVIVDGVDLTTELGLLNGLTAPAADLNQLNGTNAVTADFDKLAAVTATAIEINRSTDVSARLVAAGSTLTLTEAAHEGKTILLDTITGSVVDLPAATGTGGIYRFVVFRAATSNAHIIRVQAASSAFMDGVIYQMDTDVSPALTVRPALDGDAFDTITLNGTTSGGLVGDEIVVQDLDTDLWFVRGHINATGTIVTPFSSVIT